jgi:tripartite-type tricarboxylate transporter receptor subunit TctC
VAKIVNVKDVVETLAQQGMEPRGTQPADWQRYMEEEKAFYTKVVKDAGIKPPQ